mmetsp:Transcript_67311/g.158777  ORF Transcript_67311/g.158777 Transcript_67311/m.158777 type:complete len:88 (-) Transcript_67311:36-299(-)
MLPPLALQRLHQEIGQGFDTVCVIGTTAVFPYIQDAVLNSGATTVIEINPGEPQIAHAVRGGLHVQRRAAHALQDIYNHILSATSRP